MEWNKLEIKMGDSKSKEFDEFEEFEDVTWHIYVWILLCI
jgi:hypothetical protein